MALKQMLALAVAAQGVSGHSWVETVRKISSTGSFTGAPGYAMGYMARTDPGFSDDAVLNKILDPKTNPAVCKQYTQGNYNDPKYQPIKAAAGDLLAMQWEENGHVTQPDLTPRPYRSGNVYIYGSLHHTADVKLNDVMYAWNTAGTGGNKQGQLLASHFFDDGKCYQNRGGLQAGAAYPVYTERFSKSQNVSELLCQGDFQLPSDLPASGNYTVYWTWDWSQKPNEVGSVPEIYTSCATIQLGPSDSSSVKEVKFQENPDVAEAAVQSQLNTPVEVLTLGTGTASPPAPTGMAQSKTGSASASAAVSSSSSAVRAQQVGEAPTTVTVTKAQQTVFVTMTVKGNGQEAAAARTGSAVTSVTPFAKNKARVTGGARRK